MIVTATILGVLGCLVGAVMLVVGLRGRRADDHPLCRKCGYDLSGTAAVPATCPECGRDLQTARKPVRVGNRRRRPRFIVAGALLLALSLGVGGPYVYNESRDVDWNTLKPVWWLTLEAQTTPPAGKAARAELLRRLRDAELSDRQAADLVTLALDTQADGSIPWDATWGEIIEYAWSGGELSSSQIEQYVQTAFEANFDVQARRRIRAGAPLPLRIGVFGRVNPQIGVDAYRLSAQRMLHARLGGPQQVLKVLAEPAGVHTLTFVFDCIAWEQPFGQRPRSVNGRLERPDDPITSWTVERSATIEVAAPDDSIIDMVDDASLADAVRASIVQVEFIKQQIPFPPSPNAGGGGTFGGRNGMIIIDAPPIDLSFDVYARSGDEEHRIGGITARADGGLQNAQDINAHPASVFPDATTVDLILRAAPGPAERTLDITRAWNGEIVIEDVPIRAEE